MVTNSLRDVDWLESFKWHFGVNFICCAFAFIRVQFPIIIVSAGEKSTTVRRRRFPMMKKILETHKTFLIHTYIGIVDCLKFFDSALAVGPKETTNVG